MIFVFTYFLIGFVVSAYTIYENYERGCDFNRDDFLTSIAIVILWPMVVWMLYEMWKEGK